MKKYFEIPFEFNRDKLEKMIEEQSLASKGYCCFVDSYVLVSALRKENGLMDVLNQSTVNACDGSYIALFASRLYHEKLSAYNGPEFFAKYIYHPDRHCIIGNTEDVYSKIKARMNKEGFNCDNVLYISVPFQRVEYFDYEMMASEINAFAPRYIWVSLGAPKQELFMSRMLPHLNKGMMLGVGAALNFFSGEIATIPAWAKKTKLIWMYRIFTEPGKQFRRSFFILRHYVEIYRAERRRLKNLAR
ncbi:MAG: WecB/TagA/CpsF family glycosyltransferase [Paludibacter sp.]|jgi:N-acetylglucosaminyldiphosphoundecaprenol N-acetyl-beta-D-mannosaminyltransferase|nr:WecB/TagA/CpsF family glycosyltransferase [Paludibacter sp.]